MATVAPRLARTLIREEISPVTEIGTAATGFLFNEPQVPMKLGIKSRRELLGTT